MSSDKKLRLLILTRAWPVKGGTEQWLESLVRALKDSDLEIVVGVAFGRRFNLLEEFLSENRSLNNYLPIDGTSGSALGRQYQIKKVIRKLKPDVVLPLRLYDALVSISKDSRRTYRVIYALHEYRAQYLQDIKYFNYMMNRIVVCDELSRRIVLKVSSCDVQKLTVITQGVDEIKVATLPGNPDVIQIGYVGRIEDEQKRTSDLVALCEYLEVENVNFILRIAGTGPDEDQLRKDLAPQIQQGTVIFEGWKSQDELERDFYPGINVLVICSSWETGPIVAWEAMMQGVVVVTSRYRGLNAASFLVDNFNSMIFDVGDMYAAAQKIKKLKEDPASYQKLSHEGMKSVQSQRSLGAVARQWESLISEVCDEKPVGANQKTNCTPEPKGLLESLPVPISLVERLRKITGKQFVHQSPGEEWPFFSIPGKGLGEEMEHALDELDYRAE